MNRKADVWPALVILIGLALGMIVIVLSIKLGKWTLDLPIG